MNQKEVTSILYGVVAGLLLCKMLKKFKKEKETYMSCPGSCAM